MNIVYHQHGHFVLLSEGFKKAGHTVFPVSLTESIPFDSQVEAVCKNPDFVFIEIYGKFTVPEGIERSKFTKVAYCIDSSIHEYILCHILNIFDHVFVDQKSSVTELQKWGINAAWLPLCVPDDNFRKCSQKEHDITFVGAITGERKKRIGLLNTIKKKFNINIQQDVTVAQMQDIFSASKIVLNENLFDGVNLRVFQALASGSLVLTEGGRQGLDDIFQDHKHIICYDHNNIIPLLETILHKYEDYSSIAKQGYELCKTKHSSLARALQCLELLNCKAAYNLPRSQNVQKLAIARALHAMCLRFGGNFIRSTNIVSTLAAQGGEFYAESMYEHVYMAMTAGKYEQVIEGFSEAINHGYIFKPLVKIFLIYLNLEKYDIAIEYLRAIIQSMPKNYTYFIDEIEKHRKIPYKAHLRFILAKIYFKLGFIFHVGFACPSEHYYPESALELAFLSWQESHDPKILNFIILCYSIKKIESEAIPLLEVAIAQNKASPSQYRHYEELKKKNYLL